MPAYSNKRNCVSETVCGHSSLSNDLNSVMTFCLCLKPNTAANPCECRCKKVPSKKSEFAHTSIASCLVIYDKSRTSDAEETFYVNKVEIKKVTNSR